MATDFDPPFGENGELTAPTTDQQSLGFDCGPASRSLFNYLFNLQQGQIANIAAEAGVASASQGDPTVLYRAVAALIAAATGEGETSLFVLMSQARARLPIYPEVLNVDGRIVVTAPATGTVRVPGGVDFLHRGIFSVTTAQEDFATEASKTYHLRWNPDDGFALKNLADVAYNPSALSEGNTAFDSDYDDMLVARIITNSSNVATITNLANKDRMRTSFSKTTTESSTSFSSYTDLMNAGYYLQQDLNWARTPTSFVITADAEVTNGVDALTTPHTESTRYITKAWAFGYGLIGNTPAAYQSGKITVGLMI